MRILRDNLAVYVHRALFQTRQQDAHHGPNFKSGHQQALEELAEAIKNGEPITVEDK